MKQFFAVIVLFAAGLSADGFAIRATAFRPARNDEISARLKPAGELCKAGQACGQATAAASGGEARTGEQVYNQFCFVCHATGVGGAPKKGQRRRLGAAPREG